jgi:FSR family fosmidomycin resistance protein-like MFS transporter
MQSTQTEREPTPVVPQVSIAELFRGRLNAIALILAIGVLRVVPALGIPLALAFILKSRGETNEVVGIVQAAFLIGIGAGSLGCALLIRRSQERRMLWLLPLWATPMLGLLGFLSGFPLLVAAAVGGTILGSTMPILVSLGQRLLPEGQRVASSITMGVTWGLGGAIVAGTLAAVDSRHHPEVALAFFAACCPLSSALCAWLPETDRVAAPVPSQGNA